MSFGKRGPKARAKNITPWRAVVPKHVRSLRAWVVWKRVPKPDKPGKFDKVPYYSSGHKRYGECGGAADRARLGTFSDALEAYQDGGYAGIGLALLPDAPVWALDLDHCIKSDGALTPLARRVATCGSYVERSPSGTGVRALYRGKAGVDAKNHYAGVEVFDSRGFVTITGDVLGGDSIIRCPPKLLKDILATVRAGKGSAVHAGRPSEVPAKNPALAENVRLPKDVWRRVLNPYPQGCDRSAVAFGLAARLKRAGLSRQETLEVMAATPAFAPALDRRGGNVSSAREWLWRYIVTPAFAGEGAARG